MDIVMHLYDREGRKCGTAHAITGGGKNHCSVLMPLKEETRRVLLELKNAFSPSALDAGDMQLDFLKVPSGTPLGVVGSVYPDPSSISLHVSEIADHYGHYRSTAESFSAGFAAYHNPSSLVRHLLEAPR